MTRSPLQILFVAVAVAAGLIIGSRLVAHRVSGEAAAHEKALMPDVTIVDAQPADLPRYGYRFGSAQSKTWRDISLREFQNQQGYVRFLRCRIDAAEVPHFVNFPADCRRGESDDPPADWPRGTSDDPFRVPAWWKPTGHQTKFRDSPLAGGGWEGRFASYDPESQWLHVWQWRRADVHIQRPDALAQLVADELAMALSAKLVAKNTNSTAVTLESAGLAAGECGIRPERLPKELSTVDVCMAPLKGAHRYFVAVHGFDETHFRAFVGDLPLRPLAVDSAPPAVWSFAHPPGKTALPDWFNPGPGPRWSHCQIELGSGKVERGRWVAYDAARHIGFVWDWEGPESQAAEADLNH